MNHFIIYSNNSNVNNSCINWKRNTFLYTAFATATVFRSSSETNSTKIRRKIIEYSQLYVLTRELNDKFYKFFIRSLKANEIENTEYKELVEIYEDHKK